jgi:hypothetical protein
MGELRVFHSGHRRHFIFAKTFIYLFSVPLSLPIIVTLSYLCVRNLLTLQSNPYGALTRYIQDESITTDRIDKLIGPSPHGSKAGIVGALFLAELAVSERKM